MREEEILAEIIPFVILEPIVLPERLSRKEAEKDTVTMTGSPPDGDQIFSASGSIMRIAASSSRFCCR